MPRSPRAARALPTLFPIVGALLALLASSGPARPEPGTPPEDFHTPAGDSVLYLETFDYPGQIGRFPENWQARKGGWRDASPEEIYYRLQSEDGNFYLGAETTGEAVDAGVAAEVNLRVYSKVRWRWRVWSVPLEANEEEEDRNDSAAAVRLVFHGGLRPRMLKYVWSSTLPAGTETESAGNSKIQVIVLRSGSEGTGKWVWEEVDAYADYKRLFGGEPRAVRVWGIISDSDNTKSFVKADYDDFTFIKTPDDSTDAGDPDAGTEAPRPTDD